MRDDDSFSFPVGKIIGIFLLVFVVGLGIDWIATGNDFFIYRYFAPKRVEVQRQVFEKSRPFNQGMIQELESKRFEYVREKDPEAKKALASIILHEAEGYNLNDPDVSQDLRDFIQKLKDQQMSDVQ